MLQKSNSAQRQRIVPQIRAAVVGVGTLLTSAPSLLGSDGAYRSLSSGNVSYVEPADLGSTINFSDRNMAPASATVTMADGMYLSSPGYGVNGVPIPTPMPSSVSMRDGMLMEASEPMQFNVGTPVIHDTVPVYQGTPAYGNAGYAGGGYSTPCCTGCDRSYYGSFEALWIKRSGDEGFSMTQGAFMDEFGYEFGGRYTIGQLFDCVDGVEGVYTGPLKWSRSSGPTTAGRDSFFVPSGTITAANIDAFNDAVHIQSWRASFQNLEFNRKWWAGDILNTFVGIRGIEYKEQYALNSVTSDGGVGIYRRNVENLLIGGQIGGDIFYPLSQRLSVGAKGRVGLFANFNQGQALLANRGVVRINAFDKDTDFAGIIESGTVARYRIMPNVVASAGYEMWYLAGVATVPRQGIHAISPASGTRVSAADEVLFHGGTAGLEISF